MPKCFRQDGYKFFFWSNEPDEPPHVHVSGEDGTVKLWVEPEVSVVPGTKSGFNRSQVTDIMEIAIERRTEILEKWREHFGGHDIE